MAQQSQLTPGGSCLDEDHRSDDDEDSDNMEICVVDTDDQPLDTSATLMTSDSEGKVRNSVTVQS